MSVDYEEKREEEDLQGCFDLLGGVEISNHLEHFAKSENFE